MFLFLALFLGFAQPMAHGAPPSFSLEMELSDGDQVLSKPRMLVKAGQRAQLAQLDRKGYGTAVEVTAVEGPADERDSVFMSFNVSYKSGSRTIQAEPTVMARLGKPALLTLSDPNDASPVSLRVTAVKAP